MALSIEHSLRIGVKVTKMIIQYPWNCSMNNKFVVTYTFPTKTSLTSKIQLNLLFFEINKLHELVQFQGRKQFFNAFNTVISELFYYFGIKCRDSIAYCDTTPFLRNIALGRPSIFSKGL